MDLVNNTPFAVTTLPHPLPDGRYALIVVAKATYRFDSEGSVAFAMEQLPVLFADEVEVTPLGTCTRFESDIALIKLRTDIAVLGTARAPNAKPVTRLGTAVHVGTWSKKLMVSGAQNWDVRGKAFQELSASPPHS